MEIKILVDSVKIYGPKIDGGYSITFQTGEYEVEKIAELLKLNKDKEITLIVKQNG